MTLFSWIKQNQITVMCIFFLNILMGDTYDFTILLKSE